MNLGDSRSWFWTFAATNPRNTIESEALLHVTVAQLYQEFIGPMPAATFFAQPYRLCSDTAKEQLNGENEPYLGDHAYFFTFIN